MQGVIVDLDYQLASEWYEKAVAQNDMYAQANFPESCIEVNDTITTCYESLEQG